jgi:replication-associated recombination protein RarA
VCNRIEICAHEDIGLADQAAVLFSSQAIEQARRFYKPERQGECMIMVGNAVRCLCRAHKSREGDHYQAVCMLNSELNDYVPEVPDFAYDSHNLEGRKRGRGVQFFKEEGTQLVPTREKPDLYEEEAFELWFQQERERQKQRLF